MYELILEVITQSQLLAVQICTKNLCFCANTNFKITLPRKYGF